MDNVGAGTKSTLAVAALASVTTTAFALWWQQRKRIAVSQNVQCVSPDNESLLEKETPESWTRATYILVMHEPPHLFYEPKEWSLTSIVLLRDDDGDGTEKQLFYLPGGLVMQGESYEESAVRRLRDEAGVDVCQPENCLHHLYTFPYKPDQVWGDCYECVYRGHLQDLEVPNAHVLSLEEIKDLLFDKDVPATNTFRPDACHALKLYFQRQGDLRAKRRLLKASSSSNLDLAHYGLKSEKPLVLTGFNDEAHQQAVDFTLLTDDGMRTQLLTQADIVLVGCWTGKTPLSIFISQTTGLKVSNIPLVFELSPPDELTEDPRIDPLRVFCLTRDVDELEKLRLSRLNRELKGNEHVGTQSTYANYSYIRKDLAKARNLAVSHGYTEVDVSERALEEVAGIIISKMKERFPDLHIK